jgi:hypothetical protein
LETPWQLQYVGRPDVVRRVFYPNLITGRKAHVVSWICPGWQVRVTGKQIFFGLGFRNKALAIVETLSGTTSRKGFLHDETGSTNIKAPINKAIAPFGALPDTACLIFCI